MKRLIKSLALGLISVGVVFAISGCGGGGGGSTTNEITHNGVTYKVIKSPVTGRYWLDRNIGAAQVCTAYNDVACYGDYFQWGRNADGHEDSKSDTINLQATDVYYISHSKFIVDSMLAHYGDWAYNVDPQGMKRSAKWKRIDGKDVCPNGFRVPTMAELYAEVAGVGIYNRMDAFNSFLKLPSAGYRHHIDGKLEFVGEIGYYWSTDVDNPVSKVGAFTDSKAFSYHMPRGAGIPVRCIR